VEFLSIWEFSIIKVDKRGVFAFGNKHSNQKGCYLNVSSESYVGFQRLTSSGVTDLRRLTGDLVLDLERDGLGDLGIVLLLVVVAVVVVDGRKRKRRWYNEIPPT
jgi:hypothetical protein